MILTIETNRGTRTRKIPIEHIESIDINTTTQGIAVEVIIYCKSGKYLIVDSPTVDNIVKQILSYWEET